MKILYYLHRYFGIKKILICHFRDRLQLLNIFSLLFKQCQTVNFYFLEFYQYFLCLENGSEQDRRFALYVNREKS